MGEWFVYIWIGFTLFMLICEALTSQLVSIWFVIGGIAAAISCIFTDDLLIQSVVFIVVSFICLLVTRPLVKKMKKRKSEPTNSDRLIGRVGIVKTDIITSQGQGQVAIDGTVWSAKTADGTEVKTGANVKVNAIEGVKLVVEII